MMSNYYKECRRCEFFFRTWSEASLAHLKKKTMPNPGAVTRRDQSNQGKNIKSL